VIDFAQNIISRLHVQGQVPQVDCHQSLTPNALRIFIPLLVFSDNCPYEYLLAALQLPEQILAQLFMFPFSDQRLSPFFEEVDRVHAMLDVVTGSRREQKLRQLRRVLTETMVCITHLGFTIISLRRVGYRLQPTMLPHCAYQPLYPASYARAMSVQASSRGVF
jgi:hypothetical protein